MIKTVCDYLYKKKLLAHNRKMLAKSEELKMKDMVTDKYLLNQRSEERSRCKCVTCVTF